MISTNYLWILVLSAASARRFSIDNNNIIIIIFLNLLTPIASSNEVRSVLYFCFSFVIFFFSFCSVYTLNILIKYIHTYFRFLFLFFSCYTYIIKYALCKNYNTTVKIQIGFCFFNLVSLLAHLQILFSILFQHFLLFFFELCFCCCGFESVFMCMLVCVVGGVRVFYACCVVVVFVFILEENGQHFQLLIYLGLCIIIAIVFISCLSFSFSCFRSDIRFVFCVRFNMFLRLFCFIFQEFVAFKVLNVD